MYKYEENDVVAIIKTTNGTINILLETELAPVTSANFIALAKKWYYDGVIFHRIIKWFMIQWGDPDGTGMWWTSIYWWEFNDEFHPELKNYKYTISMANAWANTNWSQFFINTADNHFLDWKHAVFGEVVEWTENIDKIEKTKTDSGDRPEKEVKMISLEIKEYKNWSLKDYNFDEKEAIDFYKNKIKQEQESKKSKEIESWDNISVHYTGTFENWEKFDSSYDRGQSLDFQVWAWMMIKWFDAAVVWMKIWEKKSITLSPEDAYGQRDENNKQTIEKSNLYDFVKAWFKLEVWEILPTQMGQFEIIEADDESITIDANHKMAWKTLNFDIEIVDIK